MPSSRNAERRVAAQQRRPCTVGGVDEHQDGQDQLREMLGDLDEFSVSATA